MMHETWQVAIEVGSTPEGRIVLTLRDAQGVDTTLRVTPEMARWLAAKLTAEASFVAERSGT